MSLQRTKTKLLGALNLESWKPGQTQTTQPQGTTDHQKPVGEGHATHHTAAPALNHIGKHKYHSVVISQDHLQFYTDKPAHLRAHKPSYYAQPPSHPSPSRWKSQTKSNVHHLQFYKNYKAVVRYDQSYD